MTKVDDTANEKLRALLAAPIKATAAKVSSYVNADVLAALELVMPTVPADEYQPVPLDVTEYRLVRNAVSDYHQALVARGVKLDGFKLGTRTARVAGEDGTTDKSDTGPAVAYLCWRKL